MAGESAVEILRIAAGGDGVGKLDDGMTVFVPRTAPGDRVTLTSIARHGRFARAVAGTLVEASPERVEPRCRHYERDRCGGCQLQHLTQEAGERAKRQIVGDAFRRLGRIDQVDPPIEPAFEQWSYRTKITLAADPSGKRIGYHPFDRPGRNFDLEHCEIAHPTLMALWSALRPHRALLPTAIDRLVLRLDRNGGRHLVVLGRKPEAWTDATRLQHALAELGVRMTLWWQPPGGVARIVAGDKAAFSATVFEQVNPPMGDRVRAYAVAALGPVAGRSVWDLYAGIGETTDLVAGLGARVESVEQDCRAVEAAERRAPSGGGVRRIAGRAEERVGELGPPDLVITNPPRTGMDPVVIDAIGRHRPSRLVYVSCDPATLARDLRRFMALPPGGRLIDVRAFDLFPQTAHVETVAVVERA